MTQTYKNFCVKKTTEIRVIFLKLQDKINILIIFILVFGLKTIIKKIDIALKYKWLQPSLNQAESEDIKCYVLYLLLQKMWFSETDLKEANLFWLL